jgi:hypothetical protein
MWYEEEPIPEQKNAEYLWQNPHIESLLWAEWVRVVCERDKIPHPTPEEWTKLKANFYHGKAPIDSVAELKKMRS